MGTSPAPESGKDADRGSDDRRRGQGNEQDQCDLQSRDRAFRARDHPTVVAAVAALGDSAA